jgi:exosortase/archaeosortase family protein
MNAQQVGFLVRFVLCVSLPVWVLHEVPGLFGHTYLLPISWTTASALNALGIPSLLDHSMLALGFCIVETEFTLFRVEFECTGLFSLFVYQGAVLAYPTDLRRRAVGVVLGLVGFFAYAVSRLVALGLIDYFAPWWLNWFHIYLMVLLNLGFFLFLWAQWVNRCAVVRQPDA